MHRLGAVLIAAMAAAMSFQHPTTATSASAKPEVAQAVERPNIIWITTDDQNGYDMNWMPQTRDLLGQHGYTFPQAMSAHPLCCPARAQWVSGQYAQNNGVQHNDGPYGGYQALKDKDNTIASWLANAGYRTGFAGKYLNYYRPGVDGKPRGWNHWNPVMGRFQRMINVKFFNDGKPVVHPGHIDDTTTGYTTQYIKEFAGGNQPFFLWASYFAPHSAVGLDGWPKNYSRPADRHIGRFGGESLPVALKPSFNEADTSDQIPESRKAAPRNPDQLTQWFRSRIESLQAVDEGVAAIVQALAETGELDDTYLFFVSDNGILLGEHRLTHKNYLYAESMAVPLLVRVPGQNDGRVSQLRAVGVDMTRTTLDLAGAKPGRSPDGQSYADVLHGKGANWRDTQLIQSGTVEGDGWQARGVTTDRYTYFKHRRGLEFLFDHAWDPYEVTNLARDKKYKSVLIELRKRTQELQNCAGDSCRKSFGAVPSPSSG